jgi:predicted amino acid racemase
LPSTISEALIMPQNISLKKNEAMRVHNAIMIRMKEIAELPKSQHISKAPSKQHSSKVAKMVCARTVSTRSEARQLRSKTSQMKIYNMLKGSTNQEKFKHH